MLKKRIKRYVDQVVSYLPIFERKKARAIITSSIYARLDDLTMGMKPTRYDLRSVFVEMGAPEVVADAYYDDFYVPFYAKMDWRRMLQNLIRLMTVLSLVFVVFGLGGLILGTGSMRGLMAGLVLAVAVVFYQMLMQMHAVVPAEGR